MIKHFCDACGNPSAENYPEFQQDGFIGLTGRKMKVRAMFETSFDKDGKVIGFDAVDLCSSCQINLLVRLIDQIKGK